jgi:hypothetical protein
MMLCARCAPIDPVRPNLEASGDQNKISERLSTRKHASSLSSVGHNLVGTADVRSLSHVSDKSDLLADAVPYIKDRR